jgi:hypothetical protein
MYGESYFETQETNLNADINQGVFEATKNYFRADDMTSAQEKLFKFNHPAGRGLDQSTINIQDKLTTKSGGEFAKEATSSSSIIQPRFRSGGVLTINVTSLIESGSDQELQVQVQLNPLNEFSGLKAVENYSAMETNLFGNVLSTGKSDAEIFAAKSHNYGMEPTTADNVCYVSGQGSRIYGLGPATKFYLPSPRQCLSLSELPFLQVYVQANVINTASPNHQGAEVLPAKEGRSNANASQINANILQPTVKEPDISLCIKSEQLEIDIINLTGCTTKIGKLTGAFKDKMAVNMYMRETTSTLIATPDAANPISEIAILAKEQEGISTTMTETSAKETHYDDQNGYGSQAVQTMRTGNITSWFNSMIFHRRS